MPPHFPYPPPSLDTPPGGDVSYFMFHHLIKPNMKTKTLILAALSAVVLAGCDMARDVFVPALPEVYWGYFPYEVGDTIIFTNGAEDMAFEIQSTLVDKEDRNLLAELI